MLNTRVQVLLNRLPDSQSHIETSAADPMQDFSRTLSRLTIDVSEFNSNSTNQNSQFSAFNDLEYRIKPQLAALARVGYQNIRYPFSPAATFTGPTWLIGGAIGTYAIGSYGSGPGYLALQYGRQQGVYGFTGSAQYNITPTMNFTASLVQGVSGQAQYLQNTLASSSLDPFGSIVDEYSGLPTAFYSPGLGLTNNVYRQHLLNFGITETIARDRYSLFGTVSNQQSLTPPITAPTKSYGINLGWYRDIRPDLNGSASLGFVQAGVVKAIAHTGVGRLATLPDLPPVSDTVPGFEAFEWNGVFVPTGTPAPIVQKLNAGLNAMLKEPAVVDRLNKLNVEYKPGTPEDFRAFVAAELEKWGRVVKDANIKLG